MESFSQSYKARCIKRLNGWNAPLSGWECIYMYDVVEDSYESEDTILFTCELCDCSQVRYVHVMHHKKYFEDISVGCICAGIMEGNILAAKKREREMKNRAKRKANYLKREWQWSFNGNRTIIYKNRRLTIISSKFNKGGFGIICDGRSIWSYKGKRIMNHLTAVHAAFDLIDPPIVK
ncbi:MAG: hypothetical protein PHC69_10090 [Ruminiclostridium sp.]|nr:hypothetical protein [Ruminiclostridium sp.]